MPLRVLFLYAGEVSVVSLELDRVKGFSRVCGGGSIHLKYRGHLRGSSLVRGGSLPGIVKCERG